MAEATQFLDLSLDGTALEPAAISNEIEQILFATKDTPVVAPEVSVSDFKATVDLSVIPESIQQEGLSAFSDRLQSQARSTLSSVPPIDSDLSLAAKLPSIGSLASLESSLARSASFSPAFIRGTDGADLLAGTQGNDVILALGGDDVVIALNGSDFVRGGKGNDIIVGGGDRDFLFGEEGNDTIFGDSSDGLTFGVAGNDTINGGAGDDNIFAGGGDDEVSGGDGSDAIEGEDGNDRLDGGAGTDFINGGRGRDRIFGGADTDFLFGGRGADTINGDGGDDIIAGENGRDTLFGGAGNDQISGGNGDDTVIGGIGDDSVSGDRGNDTVIGVDSAVAAFGFGRGEIDRLEGGQGSDRFVLGQNGQNFYDDGSGLGSGVSDYGLIADFAVGIDKIQLASSFDNYRLDSLEGFGNLPSGIGIFANLGASEPGEFIPPNPPGVLPGELIGIVANVSVESLSASDFVQA